MKRRLFQDKEHLVRVAGLFVGGVAAFLILQGLFVPKGFGLYGHYRSGALDDIQKRQVHFAGQAACLDCHSDVADVKSQGKHAGIHCEACHWALAAHATAPDSLVPEKPNGRALCLTCHTAETARPSWFAQINPAEHGDDGPCIACHVPHNPGFETDAAPVSTVPESAPEGGAADSSSAGTSLEGTKVGGSGEAAGSGTETGATADSTAPMEVHS